MWFVRYHWPWFSAVRHRPVFRCVLPRLPPSELAFLFNAPCEQLMGGVSAGRAREILVLPLTSTQIIEFLFSVTGPMHLFKSTFSPFGGTPDEPPPPATARGAWARISN